MIRIPVITLRRFSGFYYRQCMLEANNVADFLKDQSYEPGILELSVTIKICGIEDNVIMYVGPIGMGGNNESMIALGEPHSC